MGTLFIQTRGHTGAAQMTQVAYAAFGSGFQLQSLLPYLVPGFLEAYLKHIGVGILQNDTGLQIALPVYGEGLNVRDWLYVEDHCKAIDLIIHKGRVGEVYNIGGHNEMKNIDIVKIILKELGKPESLITYVADRKGHDMRYAIDPTKIHNELGWLPETMFKDGIQKTIQWYLDNKEWWQTIISGEYQNYYEKMYANR